MFVFASWVVVAAASWPSNAAFAPEQQDAETRRAVLVTGASTGIGRKTVEVLAANGFFVYAGARKAADLKALGEIEHVQPIELDVTKQDQIDAAVKTVRDAGRGLYGLINNAGVVVVGPLIELREDDLRFQFEANVFGPYRVTKAFAPLLIESKGRVSTTGSISGTATWPMGGAYTMSKHAIEAYTDTLAMELEPFAVEVSVVDPGNYRSEIMKNTRERMLDAGYTAKGSRYEQHMDLMLKGSADRSEHKEPDEVAATFLHAMTAESPKPRYMVVPNANEARLTLKAAMTRMVQLNAEQPYQLDREALIELLDEVLAEK
jgi:NAD(P)-dependent dehydrogenase (short-subunit alcohol dehydrogenase family)